MLNTGKVVLVMGATGRQGGAVVRHMLPKGWRLRALTRNPQSHAAQSLARQGVELVQGDMENQLRSLGPPRASTVSTASRTFGRWARGAKSSRARM
jgi:NAD(P)-dependent dehydrogenase (short-subunit alcohol dehydrogenase family)